jgi:putative hydrolase
VSDSGPFGSDDEPDPFSGIPFFGDLARMLQGQMRSQGPVAWDAATQFAQSIVAAQGSEPNVDPGDRIALEELARVAELHVAGATGLSTSATGSGLRVTAVNRTQWVRSTLTDYRGPFEKLATSLPGPSAGQGPPDLQDPAVAQDPMAMLGPMFQMMAPMLSGMMAGSMVGNLGQRALGSYTLPLPRPGDEVQVVWPNVAEFGEAWSLPADDLTLWVCLHEVAHHSVLAVPHVRSQLQTRLDDYLTGFEADPGALERRLSELDPSTMDTDLGPLAMLGDPELLLGAIQSPQQRQLRPHLDALVAVVVGVVDHVIEQVGGQLIGSYGSLTEAMRRRRVEADPADRFVGHLFGLELSQATYERGQAFVGGVVERAGSEGLARLWHSERELPTPAEVDAPGLWLARIDLPGD